MNCDHDRLSQLSRFILPFHSFFRRLLPFRVISPVPAPAEMGRLRGVMQARLCTPNGVDDERGDWLACEEAPVATVLHAAGSSASKRRVEGFRMDDGLQESGFLCIIGNPGACKFLGFSRSWPTISLPSFHYHLLHSAHPIFPSPQGGGFLNNKRQTSNLAGFKPSVSRSRKKARPVNSACKPGGAASCEPALAPSLLVADLLGRRLHFLLFYFLFFSAGPSGPCSLSSGCGSTEHLTSAGEMTVLGRVQLRSSQAIHQSMLVALRICLTHPQLVQMHTQIVYTTITAYRCPWCLRPIDW
jgi:hypothetical protein